MESSSVWHVLLMGKCLLPEMGEGVFKGAHVEPGASRLEERLEDGQSIRYI